MQSAEHAQESRRLVERAQREFDAGDLPIASELLWGAAAHAIMSVAVARNWPIDSHGSFKAAIMRISTELLISRLLRLTPQP